MTKIEMIEYIESSNMIINFSKSYFIHKLKKDVERLYNLAVEYNNNKVVKA